MDNRTIRPIRIVEASPGDAAFFASEGRPAEARGRIGWMPIVVRLLVIAWSGAIIAALVDEFGQIPHLPFVTAMGMTGLLVAASFLLTRDGMRGAARASGGEDDEDSQSDLLTNLPTFKYFSRRLHDEFQRARRAGRRMSAVLIDVNNLSAVNKEYGVRAGDEVLRHVARSIADTKRLHDIVARLGDDEFGVILVDSAEEGVSAFIDRLEDRLARESAVVEVGGRSISLWAGVCSGSAISNPAMAQAEAVLEAAMASLDSAKRERERRRRLWLTA
ncbi:MAG: GGDEF domain-containing protein [Dehalococcoidia bacterium]